MMSHELSHPDTVGGARRAIIDHLRREWPFPVTLTNETLATQVPERVFVEAAARLQEEGLIMYEALLIGAGPAPQLIDAVLTRRGQAGAGAG